MSPDPVRVEGEVVAVRPRSFEDFDGGGFVAHDQVVVAVSRPDDLAGRRLRVVLDRDDPEADRLRQEGPVTFTIERGDLDLDVLFVGALQDVGGSASG